MYCFTLYECIARCVGEGLRAPIPQSLPSLAFLNTNRWKPDSKILKVHYGEESWLVKDQAWNSLLPRRGAVGLHHSSTWGYSPNVVGLIFNPHNVLYCFIWVYCMMYWEGLTAPISQSLPSLAFLNTNRWKSDNKTLKVHYEEESWFVKDQARNSLLPRRRAVRLHHSSTLIVNPHDALYCLVWMYCMMCWGRVKGPHVLGKG